MIDLQLTTQEATFLLDELNKQREHIENELVHTDARAMQADLARDLDRLDRLRQRLSTAVNLDMPRAGVAASR
jgi:hypothetical protein